MQVPKCTLNFFTSSQLKLEFCLTPSYQKPESFYRVFHKTHSSRYKTYMKSYKNLLMDFAIFLKLKMVLPRPVGGKQSDYAIDR